MKRLFLGAVIAVLCSVPGTSRAETPSTPGTVAAPTAHDVQARPASDVDSPAAEGEAGDYAARENAAPQQLQEFSGGADGIYIGAGALVVALLVVLLIAAL
jgi:hypothetical protein